MGPICYGLDPNPFMRISPIAWLNLTYDIEESNMAWDHTCNVVVISPDAETTTAVQFSTNQVSEYDGAQRFQTPTSEGGKDCADCWRKVHGLGALDFGDFRPSWPTGQEWFCGEKCLFYSIQELVVQGQPTKQRKLVGTAYRTGETLLDVPDAVQAQTLSWNPYPQWHYIAQFLGVGICCDDAWCLPECKDYVGNLVLFAFDPKTQKFTLFAEIGPMDAQTIQLGVEFSPAPFTKPPYFAYVINQGSVITFALKTDSYGYAFSASKSSQSPKVTFGPLQVWVNPRA